MPLGIIQMPMQNDQDKSGPGGVSVENTNRSKESSGGGLGKLSRFQFTSLILSTPAGTLTATPCPGEKVTLNDGSWKSTPSDILKLNTIKIKQVERKSWSSKKHQRTDLWSREFFMSSASCFKARWPQQVTYHRFPQPLRTSFLHKY